MGGCLGGWVAGLTKNKTKPSNWAELGKKEVEDELKNRQVLVLVHVAVAKDQKYFCNEFLNAIFN